MVMRRSFTYRTSVFLSFFMLGFLNFAVADDITVATDYDGDGFGDLIAYDSSTATFSIRKSSTLEFVHIKVNGSSVGDIPANGDYNGDMLADLGTYNRTTGVFHVAINGGVTKAVILGQAGDLPIPANYLGRECSSFATYSPSTGVWSLGDCDGALVETFQSHVIGGVPLAGDIDCDGKADPVLFSRRDSSWTFRKSSQKGWESFYFGLPGDIPFVADFDADGCGEAGIFRPSSGHYYFAQSYEAGELGVPSLPIQWGLPGDRPVIVNVNGDDIIEYAVFRPSEIAFYVRLEDGNYFRIPFSAENPHFSLNPQAYISNWNVPMPVSNQGVYHRLIPGDYNRDNQSEFALAEVNRSAGTTAFHLRYGDGRQATFMLPSAGDAMVPADYDGDGRVQPAVVFVRSDAVLEWSTMEADGSVTKMTFGQNGDQPIAGDFDCDGKADRAVVRNINGYKYWFFSFSRGGNFGDYLFGLATDTIYAADVDGDTCDELLVSRNLAGGLHWYYRDIYEQVDHYVQWGLSGDSPIPPADLNGDGMGDFVVVRTNGMQNTAFERFSENFYLSVDFGLSGDISLTGNFSGVNYSEFGVYRRIDSDAGPDTYFIRTFLSGQNVVSFGRRTLFVLRPDGSVVVPHGFGGDGGGGGGGGGGLPPATPGCVPTAGTAHDFNDGRGGAVWKPESEGVPNHAPVMLLPDSPYCSLYRSGGLRVTVLGSSGSEVSGFQRTHCSGVNGGRPHLYLSKTGHQLQPFSPLTIKVEYEGVTECRSVPDPTRRYD